jgi:hypothetical protein
VRKFGRGHLYLAYHAAFPLALTADMAYRIWANFQRDEWGELLQIPWIAVADLLLSNLCEESGELYQMDLAVRDTLLGELVAHPGLGQPRLRQLAKFLEDYVDVEMRGTDPNQQLMAQSQRWVALAYQGRETAVTAAENIAANIKQNEQSPLEVARLASLVQIMGQPLKEAGYENLVQFGQVAWTMVHGDADGRSQASGSAIASSGVQVGDVILNAPQPMTPPPPVTQTDEADEVEAPIDLTASVPRFVEPFDFEVVIQDKVAEMPANEAALAAIEAWRMNPEGERVFVVTGEKRSGKSALAAHLAQQDWVGAYHYCTSDDQGTLDPLQFIESLAAQLGNRYEAYGRALDTAVPSANRPQQKVAQKFVSQTASLMPDEEAGRRLDIGGLSLTEAFMSCISEPAHALFASDFAGEVVLVLDGLDKAMTEVAGFSILAVLTYFERVSPQMRLVVMGRPLPEMVEALRPLGITEYALTTSQPTIRKYEWQFASQEDRTQLLKQIGEYFDLSELQEMAFMLDIDYEELLGDTKSDKARNLIDVAKFQGQLSELVILLKQERPHVTWVQLELKTNVSCYDLLSLHNRMVEYFSVEELWDLAFQLQIDVEEIPGSSLNAETRGLIIALEQQARLSELVDLLKHERSLFDWSNLETIAGWAFAEYLNPSGNEAVVGDLGIRLRQTPARESVSVGVVREGSKVTFLGETEGEYILVRARVTDIDAEKPAPNMRDLLQQIKNEVEGVTDIDAHDKGLIMRDLGDGERAINNKNISFTVHHLERAIMDLMRFRSASAQKDIIPKIEFVVNRAKEELHQQ